MLKSITTLNSRFRIVREVLSGNVGVMALSWFLFGLSSALTMPYFSNYAKLLGADDLSIAYIRSIGAYALALSILIGGFLTDRIGRVKTIITGTAMIVIIQFCYAMVSSWEQLAILWIIDQVAHFYQPALSAIIMDSMPRDKLYQGFILLNIFPAIPWIFMPVLGGRMVDIYGLNGFRIGFIVSGIISAIVLVLRVRMLRETLITRNNNSSSFTDSFKELLKYRSEIVKALKIITYTAFLSPLSTALYQTYASIIAINYLGASYTDWGVMNSLSTIVSILISVILALFKNIVVARILIASGTLLFFSQINMAYIVSMGRYDPYFMALTVGSLAAAGALTGPLISMILTLILPVEIRGRVTGFQRMLENMGVAVTSLLAGLIFVNLGGKIGFIISSFLCILSTLYLYYVYTRIDKSSKR